MAILELKHCSGSFTLKLHALTLALQLFKLERTTQVTVNPSLSLIPKWQQCESSLFLDISNTGFLNRRFHVTSYQANFASHHTCDRHVGFLLAWCSIGKYNRMSSYCLFSPTTIPCKLQQSDKNISAHTWWKF